MLQSRNLLALVIFLPAAPLVIPIAPGGSIKVIQQSATAELQYQWGA